MSQPAIEDPFALLGLPREFRIEPAQVRAAQRRLGAALHPDRAANPIEAAESARRAAAINEALNALTDPLRRAEALLALEDSATSGAGAEALPPAFLVEIMELRESLDDAIAAGDDERIATLRDAFVARRDALLESIAQLFDQALGSRGEARTGLFTRARSELSVLRYVVRFLDRVASHGASKD
ncbi:MAG: Fe-S protein assembly co-chaperone HscB [Phycisphaerae bacterium]|nr:Fe-S protein assembly co-chaperone HscB [Phycisphaerae bacterium]